MTSIGILAHAKPGPRAIKLFDGGGMFLLLNPNGARWWRLKYRVAGREKLLSFGTYPEVSLKRARERREEARRLLADGRDPGVQRLTDKAAQECTFEVIARAWLALQEKKLARVTYNKARWMLEEFIFPHLGTRPISQITPSTPRCGASDTATRK
jgi:hypothetical protein